MPPEEIRRRVQHREPRGAARTAGAGPVGAAGGRAPVQLGVDAARAVARARLSAGCRLQAAGGQLGGARDEEAAHPLRQPPGAGQGAAGRHHQAARRGARRRHGGRPGADHQRAQALDALPRIATPRSTWGRRRSRASRDFPVFFIGMRRTARGYYEMEFQPLSDARRDAADRRAHRALRAPGRRADPRRAARLAVVAQALEAEAIPSTRTAPAERARDAGPRLPERTGHGEPGRGSYGAGASICPRMAPAGCAGVARFTYQRLASKSAMSMALTAASSSTSARDRPGPWRARSVCRRWCPWRRCRPRRPWHRRRRRRARAR